MKKLVMIAVLLVTLTLASCYKSRAVLGKNEYKVIDTTYISRNGFGMVLEYDVIIEIDSSYYAGLLNSDEELMYVNPRKLNFKNK